MNNGENNLIEINENNIVMEFRIEDQNYVVLCDNEESAEEDLIYFAKIEYVSDGNYIIRDIESDEEYDQVVKKYEQIIIEMEDDEYDEKSN